MKILHYIPSLAISTGGVAAYISVLSSELGKQVMRVGRKLKLRMLLCIESPQAYCVIFLRKSY